MDITIAWSNGGGYQPTDGWIILYREHTPTNINSWILATDPELPPTQNQYTLTGLTANVFYDIAVVKSCDSVFDVMSQKIYSYMTCPIISTWQGPVVNGKPTLFYSVYYEEGTDIGGVSVRLYDSTPDVFEIVGATGNGLSILFATGSVHTLEVGAEVVVTGVVPSGYDGTYTIVSKSASAFVVSGNYSAPYVSDGQVTFTPGMMGDNPFPVIKSVVGKTAYKTINGSVSNPPNYSSVLNCGTDNLKFVFPNSTNSVAGYFGAEHPNPLTSLCGASINQNGAATTYDPILLEYNTTLIPREYKLGTVGGFDIAANFGPNPPAMILGEVCPGDSITTVTTSFTFDDDATQPYRNLNVANSANLSAAICFDNVTGNVDYTIGDGLGRTNINDYVFSFTTSDGATSIPLVDNNGVPITSYNGSYNIYAPIKIQTTAPGGGNPAGYTITNAVVSGGSTTYTYTGGTNAFTIGQDVFVNNVNPATFNFATISKTITAATSNSFTVPFFTPAGTYQTGGTASGYVEITDNMTITVDLLPGPVNVITLTNQNYAGLTLIQALNQVASAINAAGTYTASVVVIAGLPYLKMDLLGLTYPVASVKFEGPNILSKGSPDIYQISSPGGSSASSISSFNYNGFLYSSFYETNTSSIVASDINNPTSATNYSHPIDIPVWAMTLVPEVPPSTVYSLDHVVSGGEYSLNIAIDTTTGYSYTANNTTVSVYDGTIFIDSQDLSLLPLGPTTPIRLMEFNTTDNTLFVFVDGSSNNFYIVDVAPWSIITSGTYGQTNYFTVGPITAWNNLTSGPTAAMGTVTSSPTIPIPCTGVDSIPCLPVPGINWAVGANDGIRSALFQDATKSWSTPPVATLYPNGSFYVYNYANENLGSMVAYNGTTYYPSYGVSGDTVRISAGISPTSYTAISFSISNGEAYGIFHRSKIVDYTANFNSRTWSNLSRYLIKSTSGRNNGANGFLNTTNVLNHTNTTFDADGYGRGLPPTDKQINGFVGLDGTANYMLFDITDGGTAYESTGNLVYVSLDGGLVQGIDGSGTVYNIQLYKDYPLTTDPVQVPLQLITDTLSGFVYGIARDARSDVDDMNVYIIQGNNQYGVIDGASKWNIPICGQIAVDSLTSMIYFTGKHTRNFYECNPFTGLWSVKVVPSLYEKVDGYTYGTVSPLSRLQGTIERIQGASYIGGGKFVVMNYLQQTFSTELKYVYDVANLFVYDYTNNTIEQALIGTGVNTYSGTAVSYNLNYYGEGFGVNDYNTDYCYGGLGIKVDSNTGNIYWKKSISDQVYFSEAHNETGIAQIWACSNSAAPNICSRVIRIWNIQNDGLGTLVPSKRTIFDLYSTISNLFYDSWYQKIMTFASGSVGPSFQFYAINPKNLAGCHGIDDNGSPNNKYNAGGTNIVGLSTSTYLSGKQTSVYAVSVTPTTITYSVRPTNASLVYNGIFPHKYAVGEVVRISGIVSSPIDELNFPNPNTSATTYATILSVTPTSFTVANITNTAATYTSGGTVVDAVWASVYSNGNFAAINTDEKGSVIITGSGTGAGLPGYNNTGTTFILKYGPNDVLTQRENPSITATGLASTICSASPDGLFRGIANITAGINRVYGQLNNAFSIHIPTQSTYWIMGTKSPTCNISNITNAVYNAGTQTVRYFINNSFLVGKNVNIAGITPTTYNLNNVTITAVDTINSPQQWFDISYTGADPGAFIPPTPPTITGTVVLTPSFVIKVLDDTTLATIATIDLSFINTLLTTWTSPDGFSGRFQYSEANEEIYLYGNDPALPIYTFSTITNTLVKTSSLNRMVFPYNKLTTVFGIEDVNGVPYFSAYTATDTPTRRWFRLDLGNRTYQNGVHNFLNVSATDVVGTTTKTYYIFNNLTTISDTFGQWKEITDTTWATIPSNITVTLGTRLEFTSFIIDKPIVEIRNITQGTAFDPTSASGVPLIGLLIDGIVVQDLDVLEFEFANPDNIACPFINQTTIYII